MNDEVLKRREVISALADGQLRGDEFAQAVQSAVHDAEVQGTWDTYHLVGDVLRNGALGARGRDHAFVSRLAARLHREPMAQRPAVAVDVMAGKEETKSVAAHDSARAVAANAPSFRWKMVAGFASLAAVAAIGWNMLGGLNTDSGQSQLALVPVPPVASTAVSVPGNQPLVMIRDSRLDELLAAHKQFGGTSALQMPAGFLRNATFEGGGR
ncbi:MAG TPA: sigma-E factor negative regulatory protein [Burkholderiaceae bacterium]|nr:sigma-E factor negative regulatory protein [Burkholderiaceae bacterium]